MEVFTDAGQNAYFYDAAEGLIASTILLVSEFCRDGERHIVSVFKIIQELLQTEAPSQTKVGMPKPKNEFQKLLDLLPEEHKARWFAGAALNSPDASMHSVMSTAMSRMLSFIDSELEQILCFDSEVDAERFCIGKVAVFIVFPEEDMTKYFIVSLFVTQLYNECLTIAKTTVLCNSWVAKIRILTVILADTISRGFRGVGESDFSCYFKSVDIEKYGQQFFDLLPIAYCYDLVMKLFF